MEEAHFWVASFLVWLTLLSIYLLPTFLKRKHLNLPPGPKPWPVIGNLNLIGSFPYRSLHDLSKNYGPIMQLRFGSYPVVVGSSPEMAKIFLKTMGTKFASRPRTSAGKYTTYNYSDMTWSPYGPYWRQARKMCQMELFSPKRLQSFEYIRVEEIKSLLKELLASSGNPVALRDYLTTMSLNIITRMVLGKTFLDGSNNSIVSPEEFKEMLDELFLLNGVLNIGDLIPCLSFLDLQGYVKRMKIVSKKFDKFLEHVLTEHQNKRKDHDDNASKDMVDVLLELAEDPDLEVKLERHGVKGFTQDLLAGGTETSATAVDWAMSELLKNPKILEKATVELDKVIGQNKWVRETDIPSLPYIEAIVKETMRLHAPMMVPHESSEDCKVAGYDIQKGTMVIVNVWSIARDPLHWENPDEFSPDRFIGTDIDIKGQHFQLLPFGTGRRMCPGYSLGLKVVQASLANLIHGFNWKLADNMKPEDLNMEESSGLSNPRKIPLKVLVEPRLPLELYSL